MAEISPEVMRTISVLRSAYTESALVAFIVPRKYLSMFYAAHGQFTHPPGGQLAYTHNNNPIHLSGVLHEGGFVGFQDVEEISLVPIMLEIEGETYK